MITMMESGEKGLPLQQSRIPKDLRDLQVESNLIYLKFFIFDLMNAPTVLNGATMQQ